MNFFNLFFLTLISSICLLSCSETLQPANTENQELLNYKVSTLILVRHTEKHNDTDTATLTTFGMKQANNLAKLLQNTELNMIYTTPYPRVRMTAIPTAMSKNLELIDYKAGDMKEIEVMINENVGKTALVIGHKTTIPQILNHYLDTKFGDLETDNDLFILHIDNSNSKANSLTHLYYE